MTEPAPLLLPIDLIQKGHFIQLDLSWMDHPFPKNAFRISSDDQLRTLRMLGLKQVRVHADKSDAGVPLQVPVSEPEPPVAGGVALNGAASPNAARPQVNDAASRRAERLSEQRRSQAQVDKRYGEVTRAYRQVMEQAETKPAEAAQASVAMVNSLVHDMASGGDAAIRLMSDGVGDRLGLHAVNVMVVSLLLGRSLGLSSSELQDLGLAAFLHDLGKISLQERMRHFDDRMNTHEVKAYQEHVSHSITLGKRMGLPVPALVAIAQHHEMVDGTGFPIRLRGERMSTAGKILALVNRYDNLCNPLRTGAAMTPHEALSLIFAQMKARFDPNVLGAFIRMMGVYPPGSVVQLVNDRFAVVLSVNSSRALRPRVLVHDTSVPAHDALVLDLETEPQLGIRRSVKPDQLPKAAFDYLQPRQRVSVYYERAGDDSGIGALA
jgi:HD-GYP domain-containing protein (c-di-GMP phosphodiesterase class II)